MGIAHANLTRRLVVLFGWTLFASAFTLEFAGVVFGVVVVAWTVATVNLKCFTDNSVLAVAVTSFASTNAIFFYSRTGYNTHGLVFITNII